LRFALAKLRREITVDHGAADLSKKMGATTSGGLPLGRVSSHRATSSADPIESLTVTKKKSAPPSTSSRSCLPTKLSAATLSAAVMCGTVALSPHDPTIAVRDLPSAAQTPGLAEV
jgi:hypothetical protein